MVVYIGIKKIEYDKRIKTIRPTQPLRQADQTYGHLSKHWLPANPQLLRAIQHRIKEGAYETNRALLLEHIKEDPGLLLYCFRNLKGLIDDVGLGMDPLQQLMQLTNTQVQGLLLNADKQISDHSFKEMNKHQALRLQHSLLSSHTAQAVATQHQISGDTAFACATFRQLGLNLAAWNYPSIYARALTHERAHPGSIDSELSKYLNVAPAKIGAHFAAEWSIAPEIRHHIAPAHETQVLSPPSADSAATTDSIFNLQILCELSELYAQVKDPINYPQAEKTWDNMQPLVSQFVDQKVFDQSAAAVNSILEQHAEALPIVEHLPIVNETRQKTLDPIHETQAKLLQENRAIQRCPEDIKALFHKCYAQLSGLGKEISIDALRYMIHQILPQMGFTNGCLYIVKHQSFELVPTLRIGEQPLERYARLLSDRSNGVRATLSSSVATIQDGTGIDGRLVSQVAGPLNHPDYPGVLYLEIPLATAKRIGHNSMHFFNALRGTLVDCLGRAKSDKASGLVYRPSF